jgi:hypothetical protein
MKSLLAIAFLAAPFWETKAPADWSAEQLNLLLTDSPWAQMVPGPKNTPAVQIYIASAQPMMDAEIERERRRPRRRDEPRPEIPLWEEYRAWLAEHRATHIVIAVRVFDSKGFADAAETREMENQSQLRAGRKKVKMDGHFPPFEGDPYLRIAFPRIVDADTKTLNVELYVPGLPGPFRNLEFPVRELMFRGKLEL